MRKKLGRSKSETIKGEIEARALYFGGIILVDGKRILPTMQEVANRVGISISTVQRIVNKYKGK